MYFSHLNFINNQNSESSTVDYLKSVRSKKCFESTANSVIKEIIDKTYDDI